MASSKRLLLDVRLFQESWAADFGFVSEEDCAVCALCCQNDVCRTSSIKPHFETKHEKYEDRITDKGGISLRKAKQLFQENDS